MKSHELLKVIDNEINSITTIMKNYNSISTKRKSTFWDNIVELMENLSKKNIDLEYIYFNFNNIVFKVNDDCYELELRKY